MSWGFSSCDSFSHRSFISSKRSRRSSRRSFISKRSRRSNNIAGFLKTLSPGTRVVLQFDDQRPASGVFQGFQNGTVLLTNFNGFPGLVHISIKSINAVSVGSKKGSHCDD